MLITLTLPEVWIPLIVPNAVVLVVPFLKLAIVLLTIVIVSLPTAIPVTNWGLVVAIELA